MSGAATGGGQQQQRSGGARLAFAQTAQTQVTTLQPADLVTREWLPAWMPPLHALAAAGGEADAVAIVCARCELLGSLLTGETGDTKSIHFVAYCDRFLVPVNGNWKNVHNLSGASHSASELHNSFRSRALAGAPPPPHALAKPDGGVLSFVTGSDEAVRMNHMRILQNTLYIHVPIFLSEFVQSVGAYAAYLRANEETIPPSPLKPGERFRRGLWWRLRPSGLATKIWAAEGAARGIPAP
jgi:hypothetical protein